MPLKKLTKEEQIATYNAFGEAIRHEIESHSVQITCLSGDALVDAGSGVAVSIAHRYFIFTAAHVVRPYTPKELWLLPRKGGAMAQRIEPVAVHYIGGMKGDLCDAAVIELDQNGYEILGLSSIGPDRITHDVDVQIDQLIALNGFPKQHLKIEGTAQNGNLYWTPASVITLLDPVAKWADEINKTQEIWVDYPPSYDGLMLEDAQLLPDAPAMSGGGLWACNLTSRKDVWAGAKATLMGTIESWHPKERWVSVARTSQHVELIRQWYPDLAIPGYI